MGARDGHGRRGDAGGGYGLGAGGYRRDEAPGWVDWLAAGRSRAEKEAEADARLRAIVLGGVIVGALIWLLNGLFSLVGLAFGWWAVPVFVPLLAWFLLSAVCDRVLRPVELDELGWRARLVGAGGLLVVLRLVWPLWAGRAAAAWRHAHGGFGVASGGVKFPLSAVVGASPVAMGIVVFLLLAIAMVLAPRLPSREPQPARAPGGPEPVRAPLTRSGRPSHPRWP
jgi:hypothetical protein